MHTQLVTPEFLTQVAVPAALAGPSEAGCTKHSAATRRHKGVSDTMNLKC